MIRVLLAALALLASVPAVAQVAPAAPATVAADPALATRADELVAMVAGTGDYARFFSPAVHTALPKPQWDAVTIQLVAQFGRPLAVESVTATAPFAGTVRLRFERGVVSILLGLDPSPPHAVTGLRIAGSELAGDTLAKLAADLRALPGRSAYGIYALGGAAPRLVAGADGDRPLALGSVFKLWVLGELARSVSAGERRWADVVPLGRASLPTGVLQTWPAATPVTLQTLATLMISVSDNTASDTLMTLQGARLDAFARTTGAPALAPMPTTRQMFAMKVPANAALARAWADAIGTDARRRLLADNAGRLASTAIDAGMFDAKPLAIDTLEWFATPAQTAGVLDWLRRRGGRTTLDLLAVNPGADTATRGRYDYLGFKGGSETGLITLAYLARRKDGRWLALVGHWSRPDAAVDNNRFAVLMGRALLLAAAAPLD